jgi:hypothetical protein
VSRKQAKLAIDRAEVAGAMARVLEEILKSVSPGLPLAELMASAVTWTAASNTIVEAFRETLSRERPSPLADSKGLGRDRDTTEDALAECRMDAPAAIEAAFDAAARKGLLTFPDADQRASYEMAVLEEFMTALPSVIKSAGRWHQTHRRSKAGNPARRHRLAQAKRWRELVAAQRSKAPTGPA